MIYIYAFIMSVVFSLIFTEIVKRIAIKYKIYDVPKTEIKTHKEPTPYLGGIAIAGAFALTLLIIRFTTNFETGVLHNLRGILLAGGILLVVGVVDDLKDLNFKIKFFWQFVAATILIMFDMKIKFIQPDYLAIIFSYLWIIGIINAVNLIDIIDGLSSGIAIIASLTFFAIQSPFESSYVNFASITLAGACLGFLKYNFNPAKIFMGDAGSMFIGLVLAAISLGANYSFNNEIAVFTPILILIVPIYDTFYIMLKRLEKGKSIFLGSKDHVAIRLKINGWSTKKIVLTLYLASIIASILAFTITQSSLFGALGLYFVILIIALVLGKNLGKIEVD
jgi:UDP-GlcNAc:undecaprenyl-phosphate GlcNAc-1-phosphate transferase